jgi:hypothetical protein
MASTTKKATPKVRLTPALEARQLIEEQTADFLRSGGTIQHIPNGTTGQVNLAGPRQIVLAKNPGNGNAAGGRTAPRHDDLSRS